MDEQFKFYLHTNEDSVQNDAKLMDYSDPQNDISEEQVESLIKFQMHLDAEFFTTTSYSNSLNALQMPSSYQVSFDEALDLINVPTQAEVTDTPMPLTVDVEVQVPNKKKRKKENEVINSKRLRVIDNSETKKFLPLLPNPSNEDTFPFTIKAIISTKEKKAIKKIPGIHKLTKIRNQDAYIIEGRLEEYSVWYRQNITDSSHLNSLQHQIVPEISTTTTTNTHSELSEETLQNKLKKFKITSEEYSNYLIALPQLGYNFEQCQQLILRKSPLASLEKLAELHPQLVMTLQHDEIVKMAKHDGGNNNLMAYLKYQEDLLKLGFSKNEILQMVSCDGGSKNLAAVKNNFDSFSQLGFTITQIVTMVKYGGGSKNLEAVQKNMSELKALNFTTQQIVKMVAREGGAKNLVTVKDNFEFFSANDFTIKQIVTIVSHTGGSPSLVAVKNNFAALNQLNFSRDQIVRLASWNGSAKALTLLSQYSEALLMQKVDAEAILSMVNQYGIKHFIDFCKNLNANLEIDNLENHQNKLPLGLPNEPVELLVIEDQELLNKLKKFKIKENDYSYYMNQLTSLGYTQTQSQQLILRKSSITTLKKLCELHDQLTLTLQHEQIVQMAKYSGGCRNIIAYLEHSELLLQSNFTFEQIVRMVSQRGGARNLATIAENFAELIQMQFKPEQIVRIVSRDGGWKNLENLIRCAKIGSLTNTISINEIVELSLTKVGREKLYQKMVELASQDLSQLIDFPNLEECFANGFNFLLEKNQTLDKFQNYANDSVYSGHATLFSSHSESLDERPITKSSISFLLS